MDKTYAKLDAGHGDMLVGTHAPETMWPLVTNWLRARLPAVAARPSASVLPLSVRKVG